uniref:J domain-containing protein n=1 Tax=Lepeophtheirus salmonis TaxID=72036 RepID=A0A0K2V690_LEPSM
MSWRLRLKYPLGLHFRSLSKKGKTHYETLGISQNASVKDIKDSYINLSKVHHPDSVNGSAEDFRIISEAYDILSNANSKKEYDASLPITVRGKDGYDYRKHVRDTPPVSRTRSIRVDMSKKRMENAWSLYKDRWEREEARWRELDQLKKEFRKDIDEIRANMKDMSQEEKEIFLEGMRQFRRPEHFKKFRNNNRTKQNTTTGTSSPNFSSSFSNNCNHNDTPHNSFYSQFREEMLKKSKELRSKAEEVKKIYENSEFLGENYDPGKKKSVKYDIDQQGEEFRISQRTIVIIFGLFFTFFIIDMNYKNDVRKTNRFFIMEEEKKRKEVNIE